MAQEKWYNYDVMKTPTGDSPVIWMDGGDELRFWSTRQLLSYLRHTLTDREWKSVSFRTLNGGRGIEIKCRWLDW